MGKQVSVAGDGDKNERGTAPLVEPCQFVPRLLEQVNDSILNSVREATGEVENAMHQRLQSCGDKKKQARQLNLVTKCAHEYTGKIQSVFEKNFDKFELYVLRNIVAVPPELEDEVDRLGKARNIDATSKAKCDAAEATVTESKEQQLARELSELRQTMRELTTQQQNLKEETKAVEASNAELKALLEKLDFLDQAPSTTLSPLKWTAGQISTLQASLQKMGAIQVELEQDTAEYKRQRVSKTEYRNLRQRFMAHTSTVTVASSDELKQLGTRLRGV
ncbi:TPA: hypothetical protein N0F65_006295 [Lagenidium giganteum]|uniref:Uncharacterized protein n=1 Tax=Lagenidium giganteum TaxID=4803 RepID=A0AAV2YK76_9STRA|nr:TPA: hypothetical protein N0F65_006295 [Lagenidium giganteum]